MRIHGITLRNYRGIEECRLRLDPSGVTIVEGPNEIGKSSLAEAIQLIFSTPASSKKGQVQELKPVHRDAGPEIEVDVETGPYRFTYFKRYMKSPSTELTVSAPKAESRTGRQAHVRVDEILQETIDQALWQALCVIQGAKIEQVDLKSATALNDALDRAAGQEVAGERENTLIDAVYEEFKIYYTDGEAERKPLSEARTAVEEHRKELERCDGELENIEDLVLQSAELERSIEELHQRTEEAERNAQQRLANLEAVERQAEKVGRLEQEHQRAAESALRAEQDLRTRAAQVQKVAEAADRVAELERQVVDREPAFRELTERLQERQRMLEEAEQAASMAADRLDLARDDQDYQRAKLDHSLLLERRERIEVAQRQLAECQELLDRSTISDELLEQMKQASLEVERAQARLDAGSPKIEATALADITLQVDGEARTLARDEPLEKSIGESITLRVPEVIEVRVVAGTSLDKAVTARNKRQAALAALLKQAGVDDLEEGERSNLARRDAERAAEQATEKIADDLRDLTLEEMDQKIARLAARVDTLASMRPSEPDPPADMEAANTAHAQAVKGNEEARAAVGRAKQRLETTAEQHESAKEELQDLRSNLKVEAAKHATLKDELGVAQGHVDDSALDAAAIAARNAAAEASAVFKDAQAELEQQDPERIRALADNARKAYDRSAAELRNKEDALEGVSANLELLGGRGLFDAREEAQTRLTAAEEHLARVVRRAEAAKLLYKTLDQKRKDARRAYVAPLREEIRRLGRIVYGNTFDVELDESLAIESRTLDRITLPFKSLSVGTQEQLGLIVRLACAALVDRDDGVPLVFDDTLGYSDPLRLESMGALLSRAGRHCQILVLTCTPGRFAHIGDAKLVSLPLD